MIKPRILKAKDRVAIVSLSSGILGEEYCRHQVELGTKRLHQMDLEPVFMPNALKGVEYIKNNPQARAEDLKTAFFDDTISGIICAIGGEDSFKLAPYLLDDKSFINQVRTHPKIFTGYSDTTNSHFLFYKLGMTTYYGPSFITDIAEKDEDMLPYSKEAFLMFFKNPPKQYRYSSPIWYEERTDHSEAQMGVPRIAHKEEYGHLFLRGEGIVSGKLLGGCLETIFDMLTGSRYPEEKDIIKHYGLFPSNEIWQDKILFLETSEEKPSADRYKQLLQTVKDQGVLAVVNALIIGKPQDEVGFKEQLDIVMELTQEYNTPIVYNMNFGHAYPKMVLPYGLTMEIDFNAKTLCINEPMFAQ